MFLQYFCVPEVLQVYCLCVMFSLIMLCLSLVQVNMNLLKSCLNRLNLACHHMLATLVRYITFAGIQF